MIENYEKKLDKLKGEKIGKINDFEKYKMIEKKYMKKKLKIITTIKILK